VTLVVDGHATHKSLAAIEYARDNRRTDVVKRPSLAASGLGFTLSNGAVNSVIISRVFSVPVPESISTPSRSTGRGIVRKMMLTFRFHRWNLQRPSIVSGRVNNIAVKESMYRHIFNQKFNLTLHPPRKDTYKKCDYLRTAIDAEKNSCKRKSLISEHELHLRKAECTRKALNEDRNHKDDSTFSAFSFDLQKAFSLPCLTNGKAHYCCQLSMYNLGIHNLAFKSS